MQIFTNDSRFYASFIQKVLYFLICLLFVSSLTSVAQTVTVSSANAASNGITPGPIHYSQKDIVLFGFGITVSGAVEIMQVDMSISNGNLSDYFSNFRLYRSADNVFSPNNDVVITNAVMNFWGATLNIDKLTESFNTTPPTTKTAYYFLLGDYTSTVAQIPSSFRFEIKNNQDLTDKNWKKYKIDNVVGATFTTSAPLTEVAGANESTNGITQGGLVFNQVDNVLFGFSISSTGPLNINEIHISSSSKELHGYFTDGRLYRSNDNTFSKDDLVVGTASFSSGTRVDITSLSEAFNSSVGQKYYYFLVADYEATWGNASKSVQFYFESGQSPAAIIQNNPRTSINNLDIAGKTFSFAKRVVWLGSTSTSWGDPANWVGRSLPGVNDIAEIGTENFTSQPSISSSVTVSRIVLGSVKDVTLTVSGTSALSILGDLVVNSGNISKAHAILSPSGTITISGVQVGEETNNISFSTNRTTRLAMNVNNLQISGNLTLRSKVNGTRNDATFEIAGGKTTIGGSIVTVNGNAASVSSLELASSGVLNLPGPVPGSLSTTGTSQFNLTGTVNYNGSSMQTTLIKRGISYSILKINNNVGVILGESASVSSLIIGDEVSNSLFDEKGFSTIQTSLSIKNSSKLNYSKASFSFPATVSLDPATTIEFNANGNQTINLGTTNFKNIIVSGTSGTKTVTGSITYPTFKVDESLTVMSPAAIAYSAAVTAVDINGNFNGTGSINTSSQLVTIAGNWTNTSTAPLSSQVTYDGVSQQVSTAPAYKDLILNGNGTLTPAPKTVGAGTLKVAGNFTLNIPAEMVYAGTSVIDIDGNIEGDEFINSGSITLYVGGNWNNKKTGSLSGTVYFDGTTNQAVAGLNYTDLVFANGGTKTVVEPATVSGQVEVKANTVLNANAKLTLLATATSNANIKSLPATADILGSVTVQSFLTGGKRTYLTMSSPIYDTGSASVKAFTYSQLKEKMIVTGNGGVAGGFDPGSAANPLAGTIRTYYEPATPSQSQYISPNKITDTISVGRGFYFYYRGDRSEPERKVAAPYKIPEAVTMEFKGPINKGDIYAKLSYTNNGAGDDGFTLVGNPYPSTIDWKLVARPAGVDKIWILRRDGNYAVYDATLSMSVNGGSQYIPSGQGFFVKAAQAGSVLKFTESSKVSDKALKPVERFMYVKNTLMSTSAKSSAAAIPYLKLALKSADLSEETIIAFKDDADSKMTNDDAYYMAGGDLLLSSLSSDNKALAINYMPEVTSDMEVKLTVSATNSGNYSLNLAGLESMTNTNIYLSDTYLKTTVDLKSATTYEFSVDKKVSGTFGSNRFKILFQSAATLPVSLTSFSGSKIKGEAELKWVTQSEENNDYFEVERSIDGKVFISLGRVKGNGSSSNVINYSFIDKNPANGTNYYRLKQVDLNGKFTHSSPVALHFTIQSEVEFAVYPNPTVDDIFVKLNNKTGIFDIRIFDLLGNEVRKNKVNYSLPEKQNVSDLQKGTYIITVSDSSSNALIARSKFVKE